jgi:hypothetical protein
MIGLYTAGENERLAVLNTLYSGEGTFDATCQEYEIDAGYCLDAPECIAAGGMQDTGWSPYQLFIVRA